jgi:ParB-like chromosome segregation protein Spo0J
MMKTTTDFKLVNVDKLVPYHNNARTHSPDQINKLRSSLREFGFINPIIIDKDYGIIAGHGRLLAAKPATKTAMNGWYHYQNETICDRCREEEYNHDRN